MTLAHVEAERNTRTAVVQMNNKEATLVALFHRKKPKKAWQIISSQWKNKIIKNFKIPQYAAFLSKKVLKKN